MRGGPKERPKAPVFCTRCGKEIPRFEEFTRIILGCKLDLYEQVALYHKRDYPNRNFEWWEQSRKTVKTWRFCPECAQEVAVLIDGFVTDGEPSS